MNLTRQHTYNAKKEAKTLAEAMPEDEAAEAVEEAVEATDAE